MSNPRNILSDFHTYSYHHLLIVCEGYNTASALSFETDLTSFRRDPASAFAYAPRQLNGNPDLQYVVLVDTMTDVKLSIKDVKWETILAPRVDAEYGLKYSNTIEVDGTIQVVEPYGIEFYEILSNITRDLQRDPASLVYMLKTIFVGHHKDGSSEVIPNVRPFIFNLIDITSVIDNTGTTYELAIVGSSNGMAKMPQHANVGEKISLTIKPEDTVGSMLKKLEQTVNDKYQKYKEETFDAIRKADPAITPLQLEARFQDVYYSFDADPEYFQSEYRAGNVTGASETDEQGVTRISSGHTGTIETMMQRIIESSQQCDDDGAGKNAENQRYLHKIVSFQVENPDRYEVRHEIRRYKLVTQDKDGNPIEPQPGEFIEFDYIYTGKNIDILEFDIKLDFGLSFFLTLANSRDLPINQGESIRGVEKTKTKTQGPSVGGSGDAEVQTDRRSGLKLSRAPLFMGTDIKDPFIKNKINPLSAASYESALTRHAQLEHVEASLKIIGNPNLMDEIIDTSGRNDTTRQIDLSPNNTGAKDVTRTPALCKVNVKFPNSSEFAFDPQTSSGVKPFWYRGFYNMYSIENVFSEGQFIQNILMFSVPVSEEKGIDKSNPPSTVFTTPTPDFPPVQGAPCVYERYPYGLIAGVQDNANIGSQPFDETNAFIKRVEEIAANLSTLPEWLIAVMSFETGGTFSPSISNPNSTATGLIQFLESTAQGLGTSTTALAQMTALQQLDFVERYFAQYLGQLNSLEAVYTAVLAGTAYNDPNTVLFTSPSQAYVVNAGLDLNGDNQIVVGEAATLVATRLFESAGRLSASLKASNIDQSFKDAITFGVVDQAFLDAVRAYQEANGLVVTGFISDEFGRHILPGLSPTYSDGCEDDNIFTDPTYPRNQRNNNPGNIEKQQDGTLVYDGEIVSGDERFARFSSPQFGIRAMMVILRRSYVGKRKLNTVQQIIERWAPTADNSQAKTRNYVKAVSTALGVGPDTQLQIATNDDQLIALVKAMAVHEGGKDFQQYSDSVYREAMALFPR